jgi:hypothetical protein
MHERIYLNYVKVRAVVPRPDVSLSLSLSLSLSPSALVSPSVYVSVLNVCTYV